MKKVIFCLIKILYVKEDLQLYYRFNQKSDIHIGEHVIVPDINNLDSFQEGVVLDVEEYIDENLVPKELKNVPEIFEVINEEEYDKIIDSALSSKNRIEALEFYDEDNKNNIKYRFETLMPSDIPYIITILNNLSFSNDFEYEKELSILRPIIKKLSDELSPKILNSVYHELLPLIEENKQVYSLDIRIVMILKILVYLGDNKSSIILGEFYKNGRFFNKSLKLYYKYNIRPAKFGNLTSIRNLGYCYLYGYSGSVDYSKAFEYFSLGSSLYDDVECLYRLGDMYLNGIYVHKEDNIAYKLYLKSYLLMNNDSFSRYEIVPYIQHRLARCYLYGYGISINLGKAKELLEQAKDGIIDNLGKDEFAKDEFRQINLDLDYLKSNTSKK